MYRLIYIILRLTTSINYWLSRRLTNTGKFASIALIISAAFGIDTSLTLAHMIFTLLVSMFLFSFITNSGFRVRFRIERQLPPFITAGDTFRYQLTLINSTSTTKAGLILRDQLADPRPTYAQWVQKLKQTPRQTGSLLRFYSEWRRLLEEKTNVNMKELTLPVLVKNQSMEFIIDGIASHRGRIEYAGVSITRSDPLGLIRTNIDIRAPQTLLVLPRRYSLPEIRLPGKRVYQHGGVTLAASKGDTEEFIGLRDYRTGDPLQRIHWKSFARVGKPVVKEYQDEFFERHALVLDTFTTYRSSKVFEEAVSLAASYACSIETQENLLDLMFVGEQAYTFTAGIGQLHADSLLEILAGVRMCEDKPFTDLYHSVLERCDSLSSCILIYTTWDEDRKKLVGDLSAMGLPLEIFVIQLSESHDYDTGIHTLIAGRMSEGLADL